MSIFDTHVFAWDSIRQGLGEDAVYNGADVRVVFGRPTEVVGDMVMLSSRKTEITVGLDQVPNPQRGDTVELRGLMWEVAEPPEFDVEAVSATLLLRRV